MNQYPKVVGLTGGIASGKSTIARFFREAGVPVIDADKLGHMVLAEDGEAYKAVVEAFGSDVLSDGGRIDRLKLGDKVFNNSERRAELEAITHPAIARLSKQGMDLIAQKGEPLAIYEAALLVETGVYKGMEALVVVSCSVANQMKRLVSRDGFSKDAAAARIASQFPLTEKLAIADYVIDNNGTIDETKIQVAKILDALRARILESA
ncbi:MAG: dephospho-CoA kinase [Proteobacteria bacterium]|nr:dephospho-CoA kinase [Pseudomonadota bacterium]